MFKYKEELFEGFSLFLICFVFLIIFVSALVADYNVLFLFIGFLPVLVTVLFTLMYYEETRIVSKNMWILPLLLVVLLYFTIDYFIVVLSVYMDATLYVVLNVIIAMFYLSAYNVLLINRVKE